MDLSGQQGKRELVNNMKMGVRKPSQLGEFVHLKVFRIKLSSRKKDSSIKMVFRVAVGEAAGEVMLQEGSMRGHQDKVSGKTETTPGHQMI